MVPAMEANAPSAAGAAASKPRFCLGWMKAGDTLCQHSTNAAAPRHTLSTLRRPWRAILIQTGDLNLSCRLRVEKTLSNVRQEAKVTSPPCFVCFSWNGQALCTQTPRTMHCILRWHAYSFARFLMLWRSRKKTFWGPRSIWITLRPSEDPRGSLNVKNLGWFIEFPKNIKYGWTIDGSNVASLFVTTT